MLWSAPAAAEQGLAPAAAEQSLAPAALNDWEIGMYYGIAARKLPTRAVPDGWAPHLELFGVELRHYGSPGLDPVRFVQALQPDRIELQLNWFQGYLTYLGMTRPRLPVAVYSTWFIAEDGIYRLVKCME